MLWKWLSIHRDSCLSYEDAKEYNLINGIEHKKPSVRKINS